MSATAAAPKTIPMKDAAERVLQEHGGPMKVKDITAVALDREMIRSTGATPDATLGAQLALDVKRSDSRFVRTEPGTFGLKGRDRRGTKAKPRD